MQWRKLVLLVAFFCQTHMSYTQTYWQQEVNYTIDVSLNDVENSLTGYLRIQYTNHSPDTLHFIWFHLWPNAYKNDKTAFSDQLLENSRSDFYFSDKEQRGYINRLDFRINGTIVETEDHPEFIDIIKVILPDPLPPGNSINITTPFYEKLPFAFSRGGHNKQSYLITQWYPKPAVYDHTGWHPIPYLDQGEFYSEFGNYDVRITIPKNYMVAATGELQNEEEKKWMMNYYPARQPTTSIKSLKYKAGKLSSVKPQAISSDTATKTVEYTQDDVHDFAWFADKNFIMKEDTAVLRSGRIVNAYSFYHPEDSVVWENSITYIKDAIHFHSTLVGEYPFNTVTVVEANMGIDGGMEYPTITSISPGMDADQLEFTINHEIGHNWFYGVIGSNERRYPWMDEGINTYYDNRYKQWKQQKLELEIPPSTHHFKWLENKLPDNWEKLFLNTIIKEKLDQPISTSSEDFSEINYQLVAYTKTGLWMKQLEDSLGPPLLDSCMHEYFRQWQFRHPYPEDLKSLLEKSSGRNLDWSFSLLDKKGPLTTEESPKKIKPTFLFSLNKTDKFNYVNILPAIGYNLYDQFMVGACINNINLPLNNFQFYITPMYATGSNQLSGIGGISYSIHPDNTFQKISFGVNGSNFSTNAATDTNNNKLFERFFKIVPFVRLTFKNKTARSTSEKWIDFKTYLITEKEFNNYIFSSSDSLIHPTVVQNNFRYLNQLTFTMYDFRALYPYNFQIQLQQADAFYRINLTANYFFNYAGGGGMNVRFFGAKFGQIGNQNEIDQSRFEPKLLGVTGKEDYTYDNYFLGRSASYGIEGSSVKNSGLAAQQIMIRDGGLKLRIDQYDFLQGRSENWVSSLNFATTLPNHLFPVKLPIKIFFDVGTYAEAWNSSAQTSRFLYVGGFELSLFGDILNVYAPIIYSSDFADQLKTNPQQNTFWKKITFSINTQNFNFKKISKYIPF